MIGLKQKILFQIKHVATDICYDPKTIQELFLQTVYQGLGSKHTNIRQQLRPLPSNIHITDEEILSQVMKVISDENKHQRRQGHVSRQRATHTHYVQVDEGDQAVDKKER